MHRYKLNDLQNAGYVCQTYYSKTSQGILRESHRLCSHYALSSTGQPASLHITRQYNVGIYKSEQNIERNMRMCETYS